MPRIVVTVAGFDELHEALRSFGPGVAARLMGPALAAAARVVRKRARTRNFGFTDRTGRLRKSIRVGRFGAEYGGRKYRSGAARVIAGGVSGARQGHLVERGQPGTPKARPYRGGPQNARPRLFIETAQLETVPAQEQAVAANLRRRWPRLLAQMQARAGRARTLGATFGRRVSLRGRRRR